MIITDIDDLIERIESILVEVGQSDPQFKLGDWITYKPHEVRKILEQHKDELEEERGETMTIEEIDRKAAEMIQEYRKTTGSHADEFVFNVEYRHHSGEFYMGSYEPCSYDENSEKVDWYNDWWEGEQDVVFVRVVPLYDIIYSYFEALDREDGKQ